MDSNTKPVIKKKRRGWITLLVLVVIAAGIFFFVRYRSQQQAQTTLNALVTQPYTRTTLVSTISGTGSVRASRSVTLSWQSSGTVGEVNAVESMLVEEGDLLLALDESKLPAEMIQAELNRLNAENALRNLENGVDLQRENLRANIANAEGTLRSLQSQISLLEDRVCAEWRVNNLKRDYDTRLEEYQDSPTEINLARLNAAKADLDFCDPAVIAQQISDLQTQVTSQQAAIDSWSADLVKILSGPDPDNKQTLELQLALAEKQLEGKSILAPFNGTVTMVNNLPGDTVSPGAPVAQVADLDTLIVEVPISEVDIPQVEVGQQVELVFDAYYNETFEGQVSEIALVGTDFAGVVNYTVTIEMTSGQDRVKPGMTAGITILTGEKPNTFTAPVEAVVMRGGQATLYVVREGVPVAVDVETGAYSNNLIEILSGDIEEGEQIILNPPTGLLEMFTNFRQGLND